MVGGTILDVPKHNMIYYAVLVAEVTQVSMGVGYEIGRAAGMGKKILCLYRPQEKSECTIYNNNYDRRNLLLRGRCR